MIAQLNTIGDSHTASLPFEEQASGISSVGSIFGGLTATRSVAIEYRHSEDNATWSAWMAFTTPILSALTFDADKPLYQQVRATRTGTDTTGVISWEGFNIQLIIDPSAFAGLGRFTDTGLYGEVGDLITSLVRSQVVKYAGYDRFEVIKGQPNSALVASKPIVSVSAVSVSDSSPFGIHSGKSTCTALIQIAGSKSTALDTQQGVTEVELMVGRISAMFTRMMWNQYLHSFTWKGVDFVGIRLGELGLGDFEVQRTENGYDHKADLAFAQISVRFTLQYSKFDFGNYD